MYVTQEGYEGNGICIKADEGVVVMDSLDNGTHEYYIFMS